MAPHSPLQPYNVEVFKPLVLTIPFEWPKSKARVRFECLKLETVPGMSFLQAVIQLVSHQHC